MKTLFEANLHPQQMLAKINDFAQKIEDLGEEIGLDLTQFQADHIALRINDTDLAKLAHQQWADYGATISQAQINGRPIVVILFDTPIQAGRWRVECLELPYPASGKLYPEQDWEHMEFVIASEATDANHYLDDIKQRYPNFSAKLADTAEIKVKLSSPQAQGERLANPTIALKKGGVCIKLHPHSLRAVIASESEA